jgi:hypothetical protein
MKNDANRLGSQLSRIKNVIHKIVSSTERSNQPFTVQPEQTTVSSVIKFYRDDTSHTFKHPEITEKEIAMYG